MLQNYVTQKLQRRIANIYFDEIDSNDNQYHLQYIINDKINFLSVTYMMFLQKTSKQRPWGKKLHIGVCDNDQNDVGQDALALVKFASV
jgi:hypothetical protein